MRKKGFEKCGETTFLQCIKAVGAGRMEKQFTFGKTDKCKRFAHNYLRAFLNFALNNHSQNLQCDIRILGKL